jgi:hypothetical protein
MAPHLDQVALSRCQLSEAEDFKHAKSLSWPAQASPFLLTAYLDALCLAHLLPIFSLSLTTVALPVPQARLTSIRGEAKSSRRGIVGAVSCSVYLLTAAPNNLREKT